MPVDTAPQPSFFVLYIKSGAQTKDYVAQLQSAERDLTLGGIAFVLVVRALKLD